MRQKRNLNKGYRTVRSDRNRSPGEEGKIFLGPELVPAHDPFIFICDVSDKMRHELYRGSRSNLDQQVNTMCAQNLELRI